MSELKDFAIENGVLVEYKGEGGEVVLPYEVTQIRNGAFYECQTITALFIHDKVTSIQEEAICGCFGLTDITVDQNNNDYKDIDGNLYSKDGKTLIRYAPGKKETSFIIPGDVECIGRFAFCECRNLMSVWMPNSVMTIDDSAFLRCINLANVNISDSVKIIGEDVFRDCLSLKNIEIPNSVTSIGDRAFYCCTNLEHVTIPDSAINVGDKLFTCYEKLNRNGLY